MFCTTVLFDLDGTLTDSEPRIVAFYRHALAAFGRDVDATTIRQWIGPPVQQGFAALGMPADKVDEAISVYRSYFTANGIYENRFLAGVPELRSQRSSANMTVGPCRLLLSAGHAHSVIGANHLSIDAS